MEYPDGTQTTFTYDGLGRRIEVDDRGEISRFVWDGLAPMAVLDENDALVTWQTTDPWGDLLAEKTDGVVRDLLHDHMWSRTGWLEDGAVTWDPRDSFGNAVYQDGGIQHQALTWHSQDPTGLIFMQARYMDPQTGRFISQDPWSAGDQYSYAVNDPVNLWDPFGASASEYGMLTSNTSHPTRSGSVPIGCRVKCMLMTTAEGVFFAAMAGEFDGLSLAVDWGRCAFSADPGFCFPGETPVESPSGGQAIDGLSVGDQVLAMEDDGGDWMSLPRAQAVPEPAADQEVRDVR